MFAGCKQKMAEGLMTFLRNLTLTCYCKQSAILNFKRNFELIWIRRPFLNMAARAGILNLTYYYWFDVNKLLHSLSPPPFWIWDIMMAGAVILN